MSLNREPAPVHPEVDPDPTCTCGHPKSVHEPPLPGYVDECEWCTGSDWRHPYRPAAEPA